MGFTYYEYTNQYMCDTAETIIAYPARITIQMIICYFKNDGDQIKLTDAVSDSDFDSADDLIIHLWGQGGDDQIIVNWSAKPRHFYGLKVATISGGSLAYVHLA